MKHINKMKHIITILLATLISVVAFSQTRTIMGMVHDEDGEPVPGVTISAEGTQTTAVTGDNGRFEIAVPFSIRYLKATCQNYLETSSEIEGGFMVITIKIDPAARVAMGNVLKKYEGIVKDEEGEPIAGVKVSVGAVSAITESNGRFSIEGPSDAREINASGKFLLPATVALDGSSFIIIVMYPDTYAIQYQDVIEAQRKKAVEDSLRMVEETKRIERERFVADSLKEIQLAEARRIKEIRDSIRAAQIAETMRLQAIADSLQAARKDSLHQARMRKIARNDSLYRNHGVFVSLEAGYNMQRSVAGEVIYENYGYRSYGDVTPLEFDFLLGCRFCNALALSVGSGILYDWVNLAAYGDKFSSVAYGNVTNYNSIDIPVFLNLKWFMSRSKVQPMLSVSGGLYLFSHTTLANAGFGLNIRVSHGSNMYILGTAGYTPWPYFVEHSPLTYTTPLTLGVKAGLAF